jgi:antitoxin HigA-1
MSKSPTITEEVWSDDLADWLPNPHAGEMLLLEFMEPGNIDATELATALSVPVDRLTRLIDGTARIDAELDLRLARYFRMHAGFFLGLQDDYELLEARRALGRQLDRIVPRAA